MSWEITAVTDCPECFRRAEAFGTPANCDLHKYARNPEANIEFTDNPLGRPLPGPGATEKETTP